MFDVVTERMWHFSGDECLQNGWAIPPDMRDIPDVSNYAPSMLSHTPQMAMALDMIAKRGEDQIDSYETVIDGQVVTVRVMKPGQRSAPAERMGHFSANEYVRELMEGSDE